MHKVLQVCHASAPSKLLCCRWNVATLQNLMAKNSQLKMVLVMHEFINNFPSQWQKKRKLIYQAAECKIAPLCIWNHLNIVRGVAKRFVWQFSIRFGKAHNLLNSERRVRSSAMFMKRQFTLPHLLSDLHTYIHLTQIRNKQLLIFSVKNPVSMLCLL